MKKSKLILIVTISALLLGSCGGVSARESNEQGIQLYEQGNYVEALTKFNQAISQDKNEPIFYANRGMTLLMTGETEKAKADFEKALELDKKCLEAYRGIGILYMYQKDYVQAIASFNEALEHSSELIDDIEYDILEHRAEAETLYGDYEAAATSYTSLIMLGKNIGENYMKRGLLYVSYEEEFGDPDDMTLPQQAVEDFKVALEKEPQNYELYLNIYENLEYYGYTEEAEMYLQMALELPENTIADMCAKGKVFFYLEYYQEAMELFLEAMDYGDVEAYYYAAKCCENVENYEAAIAIYEKLLADETNQTAETYHQLACCLILQENFTDAEIYMNKAEKLDTNNVMRSHILWNKTIMYEKMKDYNAAYEILQEYIRYYGTNDSIERELAFIKQRV